MEEKLQYSLTALFNCTLLNNLGCGSECSSYFVFQPESKVYAVPSLEAAFILGVEANGQVD